MAFLHVLTGVWNKIFTVAKEKLMNLLDVPYMRQMPEARMLTARIAELDARQAQHINDIETKEQAMEQLKAELKALQTYLDRVQSSRGNTLTKKLRAEIADTNKRVKLIEKQLHDLKKAIQDLKANVKRIEGEIKELAGPMSRCIRETLSSENLESS